MSSPTFPRDFDETVRTGGGDVARFGRDVLAGLVDGIREEVSRQRERASQWHWGTGVLGCAMWMDDPELMDVLTQCQNQCVVVTKQPRDKGWSEKDRMMRAFELRAGGEGGGGLVQAAYRELAEWARPDGSGPLIVGPGTPDWQGAISPLRELGFRKSGNHLVPIVHAKLLLVGEMRWTDEHASGYSVDELSFVPKRLWVGSANFTARSRLSLEMGSWTSVPDMMTAARRFLLTLVAWSEPWGSLHDDMSPELTPIEYDEVSISEYLQDRERHDEY